MALNPGQRVSTPHPKYTGRAESVYVRDAPDKVVGPAVEGRTERRDRTDRLLRSQVLSSALLRR